MYNPFHSPVKCTMQIQCSFVIYCQSSRISLKAPLYHKLSEGKFVKCIYPPNTNYCTNKEHYACVREYFQTVISTYQ